MGETIPTFRVPPGFGATVADGEAVPVPSSSPQAARILPTAVAERPTTVALTSSWRLLIRPCLASLRRWSANSRWNGESLIGVPLTTSDMRCTNLVFSHLFSRALPEAITAYGDTNVLRR